MKRFEFRSRPPVDQTARELQAAGDIAQAFLTANSPSEVYHLALERVTPLVGAAFSCIFLREPGESLLEVVADRVVDLGPAITRDRAARP